MSNSLNKIDDLHEDCLDQVISKDLTLRESLNKKNIIFFDQNLKLSDLEAMVIISYTRRMSKWLNSILRNKSSKNYDCARIIEKIINKGLHKIPGYNDKIVYRQDHFNDIPKAQTINWFNENKGKVLCFPYLLSTSTDNWKNRRYTLKITTSKNSMGKELPVLNGENEVLYPSNSRFIIVDVYDNIIELHEVDSKIKPHIEFSLSQII